jgi:hypothetical protein
MSFPHQLVREQSEINTVSRAILTTAWEVNMHRRTPH